MIHLFTPVPVGGRRAKHSLAQMGSQFGAMLAKLSQPPRAARIDNLLANDGFIGHKKYARRFLRDYEVTGIDRKGKESKTHTEVANQPDLVLRQLYTIDEENYLRRTTYES